jgi:hypothetical protein
LDRPPDAFVVPEDLRGRFGYDATRRGLTFDGYMSKTTFDRLRDISYEFAYQRALEELFRIAMPEDDSSGRRGYLWVLAIVLSSALALLAAGTKMVGRW